jgi:hypothetical protein
MRYSYRVTDFTTYSSQPIIFDDLDEEEAREFGLCIAKEMLAKIPALAQKGMCVAIYNMEVKAVSVVPIDPLN